MHDVMRSTSCLGKLPRFFHSSSRSLICRSSPPESWTSNFGQSINKSSELAPAKGSIGWLPAGDAREEVMRILDIASRAGNRWDVSKTDFLSPAIAAEALSALSGRHDVAVKAWGGYKQAERVR